ncbi:uncharacterized protein LOC122790858 [Protopterus annectens]|uniref:uncharacterized protein LOC122790858 n=1 Tax=Protopterus annectens TaxID=7888 RepID=UPI001CFA9803|nr:uncharacterized protein LOC122790858 [Protopterus annectens]
MARNYNRSKPGNPVKDNMARNYNRSKPGNPVKDHMARNRVRSKPGIPVKTPGGKTAVRGGKCKYTAVLNMLCYKKGASVKYNLISTSGPPHKPTFFYRAVINGKQFPQGRGGNKKEAQGDAARIALDDPSLMSCMQKQSDVSSDKLENQHSSTLDKSSDEAESLNCPSSQSSRSSYCIFMLQDFAQKRKLKIKCLERAPYAGRYTIRWRIEDRVFEEVSGSIRRRVKQNAARVAYCALINEFIEKVKISSSSTKSASLLSTSFFQENFENLLYKYAKKMGLKADYIDSVKDASDETQYVCKWKLGDREFEDVLGSSRREARSNSARVTFCTIVNEYGEEGNFWRSFSHTSGSSGASDSRKRTSEQDRSTDRLSEEKRSRREASDASTDPSNSQHTSSRSEQKYSFQMRIGSRVTHPSLSASNALSEDEDDNEKKQKSKDKPSLNIRKIKEEEEFSQKILFGKQEELKVLSEFRESQCACLRLDKQQGKLTPKEPWFWPKLLISDDEDDSDNECSGSTLKAEGTDTKSLNDAEKLKILTSYLRENHFYCIWCRTEYNDRKELLSECPGPCREAHN